jgi:glycosyltransferase involved in cell wall biosynthesis
MDGSDAPARPLLTIITVCKDIAGDIVDTCESIVAQTFRNFEWIVVDGASTDGTLDVLERYRRRIGILVSEPDRGVYHAMNKGVALARGEYLLFLNGGDYLAEDTVLERVFAQKRAADILYGSWVCRRDDGFLYRCNVPPEEVITKSFFAYDILNHQSTFIKKALFEKFGLYDEQYRIMADWEKWILFSENGCRFVKLDFPVSVYRLNGMSSQEWNKQRCNEEAGRIRAAHFTDRELRRAERKMRERAGVFWKIRAYGSLGRFCVFSIFQTLSGRETKYKFMNVTFLKTDSRWTRSNAYLKNDAGKEVSLLSIDKTYNIYRRMELENHD